jgi:hypothetical protein
MAYLLTHRSRAITQRGPLSGERPPGLSDIPELRTLAFVID